MALTTPPRPVDVEAKFPELRPLARIATRLHPRRGNPTTRQSSIGGPLLWPAAEPWPVCPHADHQGLRGETIAGVSPLTPALQLYVRDVPELPHPEGVDLLQILWCPVQEDHAFMEQPVMRWRDSTSVTDCLDVMPAAHPQAWADLIPRPCTIDPEIVADYPYEDAPEELYESFVEHDEPFIEEVEDGWSM